MLFFVYTFPVTEINKLNIVEKLLVMININIDRYLSDVKDYQFSSSTYVNEFVINNYFIS